jgi:hypothetical protein
MILSFYFYLLYLVYASYQQENDECSFINDCFNCSLTFSTNSHCQWTENTCMMVNDNKDVTQSGGEYENINLIFFNCKEYFYTDNIISYCGKSEINLTNSDIEISLPNNKGYYGTENIFCKYSILFSEDKRMEHINFSLKLKNNGNNNEISPVYIKTDLRFSGKNEPFIKEFKNDEDFNSEFNNVYLITIYFYSSITLSSNPFIITISFKEDKSKLIIYISISCIIVVCVVLIVVICYLHKKKLKELNENNDNPENNTNRDNNQKNFDEVYKNSDKQIEYILKESFIECQYNKGILHYGTNCTICLDIFVLNKSKVLITPCQHMFHYKCLKDWLYKNKNHTICPNCNLNFIEDQRLLLLRKKKKNIDLYIRSKETSNNTNSLQQTNLNILSLRENSNSERRIIKINSSLSTNRNID